MPLVAHTALPSFRQLEKNGEEILSLEHALHQDIRELHIGFLNMMPDAALTVTVAVGWNFVPGTVPIRV